MPRFSFVKIWMAGFCLMVLQTVVFAQVIGQPDIDPNRVGVFFSTEEEFLSQGPEPPDGNPIISDGDLLHSSGIVYMRNRELLASFFTANDGGLQRFDLGLDAADVLSIGQKVVAFSTELDHPLGRFTAGDLLFTSGAAIPNRALLAAFQIPREVDLGLDAVHFLGRNDNIIKFLTLVQETGYGRYLENPGLLIEHLRSVEIDILFSTEGTSPLGREIGFLDGDLLSAASGSIYLLNRDALPPIEPAGIPNDGVDFGMDAFTIAYDRIEQMRMELYSTEIVGSRVSFTDGDALRSGNGIVYKNSDLIVAFEPRVRDVGLDALSIPFRGDTPPPEICRFTKIGGVYVIPAHWDFATGYVDPDLSGRYDHAFGGWVSIRGELPSTAVEHRVLVRDSGGSESPILMPAVLNWRIWCFGLGTWQSIVIDGDGWMNTSYYQNHLKTFCANPDLILVNWNTRSGFPDGRYTLILQIRTADGSIVNCHQVPINVDNTPPEIMIPDEHECQEYKIADMPLTINAAMLDMHFWSFQLNLDSYWIPGEIPFASGFYYSHAQLNSTGTIGYPTPVPLGTLDIPAVLTGSGREVISGRYTILFRAFDRSLLGSFNPSINVVNDMVDRNRRLEILNFEFANE